MPNLLIKNVPQVLYEELLVAVADSKPEDGHTRATIKAYVVRAIQERMARERRGRVRRDVRRGEALAEQIQGAGRRAHRLSRRAG